MLALGLAQEGLGLDGLALFLLVAQVLGPVAQLDHVLFLRAHAIPNLRNLQPLLLEGGHHLEGPVLDVGGLREQAGRAILGFAGLVEGVDGVLLRELGPEVHHGGLGEQLLEMLRRAGLRGDLLGELARPP